MQNIETLESGQESCNGTGPDLDPSDHMKRGSKPVQGPRSGLGAQVQVDT